LILISGFNAQSAIDPLPGDTKISRISGADLVCEGHGAMFAFDVDEKIV